MSLPFELRDERPLRILYLDLNSFFASVQQAEDPSLRNRPVGVCAVQADSSFLIAASYEAKAYGIKTGTQIGEAKRLCPDLVLVSGGHGIYTQYHDRILEALDHVLPVDSVNSVDEMQFRLIGTEREPIEAERLAMAMKHRIWEDVSPALNCSIGIAPNAFLAKLATDLQKPNGLVMIHGHELPDRLRGLRLTEFCGINKRMAARLNSHGIFTSDDLIAKDMKELMRAFGSVMGERWYYLLRGHEVEHKTKQNQSLGHSHVLPPDLRTDAGCKEVLIRLIQKASARLRSTGLYARAMNVQVSGMRKSWTLHVRLSPTQDSVKMTQEFLKSWAEKDFVAPIKVGVTFPDLIEKETVTFSLFEQEEVPRLKLNEAVDSVNRRFGKNSIFLAGMTHAKDTAEERIAFQKTHLFDEGGEKKSRREP